MDEGVEDDPNLADVSEVEPLSKWPEYANWHWAGHYGLSVRCLGAAWKELCTLELVHVQAALDVIDGSAARSRSIHQKVVPSSQGRCDKIDGKHLLGLKAPKTRRHGTQGRVIIYMPEPKMGWVVFAHRHKDRSDWPDKWWVKAVRRINEAERIGAAPWT